MGTDSNNTNKNYAIKPIFMKEIEAKAELINYITQSIMPYNVRFVTPKTPTPANAANEI
jgi:hypothetical protein